MQCALSNTTHYSRLRPCRDHPWLFLVRAALMGPSDCPDVLQGKGGSTETCHLKAACTTDDLQVSNQHQPTIMNPTEFQHFLRRNLYMFIRKFWYFGSATFRGKLSSSWSLCLESFSFLKQQKLGDLLKCAKPQPAPPHLLP